MKIIRLAQSGGGSIDIEYRFKPDGSYTSKVIAHNDGASCEAEDDAALMRDLLEAQVEGFGETFEKPDEEGKTPEFYEEQKKKRKKTPAQTQKPEEAGPFGGTPGIKAPAGKKKTLDMGYGV